MITPRLLSPMVFAISGLLLGAAVGLETTPMELRRAVEQQRRGLRAFHSGKIDRARKYFEKSLEIVDDFPEALAGLAHLAMRDRRFEDALELYVRAEAGYERFGAQLRDHRFQNYADAQDRLVRVEQELNRLRGAEGEIDTGQDTPREAQNQAIVRDRIVTLEEERRRLLSMTPPDVEESFGGVPGELHFHKGNALFNLDRLEDAIVEWETCAKKSPKFPLVQNNLAVAYLRTGRIEGAQTAVRRAEELGLEVHPNLKRDIAAAAAERDPGDGD